LQGLRYVSKKDYSYTKEEFKLENCYKGQIKNIRYNKKKERDLMYERIKHELTFKNSSI